MLIDIKMLKSNKFKSWQVSQSSNYSFCLFASLYGKMSPPSQSKHSYVHKFVHFQKSNFAGTTIRARGVMTNGVGITQKWGSVTFVVICEKRRYQDSLFSKTIIGNYNKGSLPHRKANFFCFLL